MVMISPCAGCDAPALAHLLALFEAISGIATIIKSGWYYYVFRIPLTNNPSSVGDDMENPGSRYRPELDPDNDSLTSIISEANANNVLWTMTGILMGTLNVALALFLLVGLTNVNYVFLVGWCLSFPLFYLLDCILFTFLLKHCTTKERFDRCRSTYISSAIFSFIFNSYVLWVGISVIHWCNCRRDPFRCRFSRDYCHSFHLNFSSFDIVTAATDIYQEFDTVSF